MSILLLIIIIMFVLNVITYSSGGYTDIYKLFCLTEVVPLLLGNQHLSLHNFELIICLLIKV